MTNPDRDELFTPDELAGVKVRELEWQQSHVSPWRDDWHTTGPFTYTIRCADENGWKWSSGYGYGWCSTPDAAKAAAQADYEARIKSAIEIAPQSDRQPLPGQKQISETGKELPKNAEQPMNNADVSVGELAGFFVTEFPHLLTMSTQIEVARALLASFKIERLDRFASGRR